MKYTEVFEQQLDEINMSPTSLDKLSSQINAMAGMEFEMIVPDASTGGEEDFESEPDLDQDERVRSFSQIREFFYDGDYNGRRDVDRLEEKLINDYYDSDWLSEKKQEAWGDASYDAIRDLVDRDYEDELRAQAEDEVQENTPEFGVNSAELDSAIADRFQELFDAKVDEILADMGREYDEAYEEWEQNEWQELANDSDWQEEWLEYEGIETMWDVAQNYDIQWPYHTEYEGGEGNIDEIADEFSDMIGKGVNASSSYHGARRESNKYVVEPDGSLDPENAGDAGLEFVSPPMPISELLVDLDKVKRWADEKGCYTNKSTGLHINVSVPGLDTSNLDYVKLALLLGDQYVLEQFQRMGNTYCKSAMAEIKNRVSQRPEDAANLLDAMKKGLGNLATKVIHSGATSKYTSINTKTGYIEFRSPGGDWLSDGFFTKIKPTLLRFVVALDAANDPQKYREEYLKKLYTLLQPKSQEDTLSYFAKFAAGELPKQALKSFVRQAQLERKVRKDPTGGQQYWWNVEWSNGRRMEVVATSAAVAKQVAAEEWGLSPNDPEVGRFKATPIKPYDASPVKATVGEPQAIGQRSSPTVSGRASNPEGNWILAAQGQNPPVPLFRFNAASVDDANNVVNQWNREHSGEDVVVHYDPQQRYGQPPIPGSTLDLQRQRAAQARATADNLFSEFDTTRGDLTPRGPGPWEIYRLSNGETVRELHNTDRSRAEEEARSVLGFRAEAPELYGVRTRQQAQQAQQRAPEQGQQGQFTGQWKVLLPNGREVYRFGGAGNSQADANRIAANWLRDNGMGVSGEGFEVVPIMSGQ
jgi:hypothetical protein